MNDLQPDYRDTPPLCPNGHMLHVEQTREYRFDAGAVREDNDNPQVLCDEIGCDYWADDNTLPERLKEEALDFYGFNP